MQIILAQSMGMCFGVRDALAATQRVEAPMGVTILGELVHNPVVTRRLAERGFAQAERSAEDEAPRSARVVIGAHGISDRRRKMLAGKEIIDTTCPLVKKAHAAARRLAAEGYFVIVLGRPDHVEVRGLIGDLPACAVVERCEEVRQYPQRRIGVLCQTTMAEMQASGLMRAIAENNPQAHIRYVDTICQPTKDRQRAMESLLASVDAIVVVGGKHSNNTRKLVEQSVEKGVRAFHIECAEELQAGWLAGCQRVGLTAGTSTLAETVAEVHARLLALADGGSGTGA